MGEPHVVTALRSKRAELAGEIDLAFHHLQRLRAMLAHLDTTLCLFDPDAMPDAIEPKVRRPQADWAKRGGMTKPCLGILRRSDQPLSNRDIALAFMTARGMDTGDEKLVQLITKRVGRCMRSQRAAATGSAVVGSARLRSGSALPIARAGAGRSRTVGREGRAACTEDRAACTENSTARPPADGTAMSRRPRNQQTRPAVPLRNWLRLGRPDQTFG